VRILSDLCSVPTAPFAEGAVIRFVEAFARERGFRVTQDDAGNLLVSMRSEKSNRPRWVFTAHMDHPGFIAEKMLDSRTVSAAFRGGVRAEFFNGSPVRFFEPDRQITGTVIAFAVGKERPYPNRATVRVSGAIAPGTPGMWDQGPGRIKGGQFYSRVCDDLAGAAAALAMLDELASKPPKAPVAVLLTRAEEEGFIGALAASIRPKLLRESDRIIAIECSAMQPYAPQGDGAIIRIGDKTSVFNSSLSYFITQKAAELTRKDKKFKYQRALMPGGTCEATVYDVYGFLAASVCVPLGNYHNMDVAKKKIGPEYIDLNDWHSMVKLFVHLARSGDQYEPGHRMLKRRLEARYLKLRHLLRAR